MSGPKRHHWWPQLNSGYWCNEDGNINVLNHDGSSFVGRPLGLGVVSHLYSKELESGERDTSIETWFASEVDGPFANLLRKLVDEPVILRRPFQGDAKQANVCKKMGYRINKYIEYYRISDVERDAISKYVSALLVRSPIYLEKLIDFHRSELVPKNQALDNMIYLYHLYTDRIRKSDFLIIKRDSENEFLFSDGGIVAREPWSQHGGIPFDVHFPLTPDYALQVFPTPNQSFPNTIPIIRVSNKGISMQNRIIIGNAKKQVFGRAEIPREFVLRNWGQPAPRFVGHKYVNGRLETEIDWSRYYS